MSTRPPRPASKRSVERPLRTVPSRGREIPQPKSKRGLKRLGIGLLVVLALGGLLLVRQTQAADLSAVQEFPSPARDHSDNPPAYAQTPPVGGIHSPQVQNCGIYDQPIESKYAVHSLEPV